MKITLMEDRDEQKIHCQAYASRKSLIAVFDQKRQNPSI